MKNSLFRIIINLLSNWNERDLYIFDEAVNEDCDFAKEFTFCDPDGNEVTREIYPRVKNASFSETESEVTFTLDYECPYTDEVFGSISFTLKLEEGETK